MTRAMLQLLRWYQAFSRSYLLPRCRYWPSCSDYAQQALLRYGPWSGAQLAVRRLLRCHPWGRWGADPVPEETA